MRLHRADELQSERRGALLGPHRLDEAATGGALSLAPPDEQVFALVYRQMHALYGRYRPDFDDLVQVASEQALRSLPSFRNECALSTWTYRICYRAVLKHRRWSERWLRRFTLDAPTADAPDRVDAGETLEQRERIHRLHAALDRLSQKGRAVVVMRDLEGLDISAISEIVGTSEGTVRTRLRDGRRKLAGFLKTDPYFGADLAMETER
jgi:RNA polymerase sigma-70 factor (ECF subfamily)